MLKDMLIQDILEVVGENLKVERILSNGYGKEANTIMNEVTLEYLLDNKQILQQYNIEQLRMIYKGVKEDKDILNKVHNNIMLDICNE